MQHEIESLKTLLAEATKRLSDRECQIGQKRVRLSADRGCAPMRQRPLPALLAWAVRRATGDSDMIRAAQLLFSLAVLFWLERQCPERRFVRRNKLRPAPMWRNQ